ncbi:hypothetical protein L1049_021156 [Liquidambar formosana]|uniref:Uncharacterized protein n=1 Tax=Liquidambar formosana TaxID=63359 RepID=A0AAP0XAN8_LIQFO
MMMIDSSIAVRFRSGAGFCSSTPIHNCRPLWCSDDVASRRLSHSSSVDTPWSRFPGTTNGSFMTRNNLIKNRIRASAEYLSSGSDHIERNEKPQYHPFEDIAESAAQDSGDARLTAAETTRTIIEVNSKATLMFSGMIDDEVHENIFWPELPYVTDEHGNIYFQVSNNEDVMQTMTSENNFVQVIIGFDTTEMINEMELSGPSEIDFGIDEIEDEESDVDDEDDDDDDDDSGDDDYEKDWVAVLEDEEDEDDSDETLGDWAKLETMRSTHPMYFAKKLSEFTSGDPIDWMDQPPAGLAIQGLLRPAFIEEKSVIQKHLTDHQSSNADVNQVGTILEDKLKDLHKINGHGQESRLSQDDSIWAEESEKDESLRNGTSFYKLEMIRIQLLSAHGHQTVVELEDFTKAHPDAIAHSAANIMSRLKAAGEKTTQALKSLCWRCKGIQVEEATLISVDTLGFDLRVCSGTQVQTLRFAFNTRATSEYSAERQLNDLLFPRIHHKLQKKKQPHQKEC